MSRIITLSVVLFASIIFGVFSAGKDDYSVDEVLKSDELINEFADCLLDKGPCHVKDAKDLKEKIPKALEDGCKTCSDNQKEEITKALGFLIKNKPELWDQLVKKFDPDNKYTEKYVDLLGKVTAS